MSGEIEAVPVSAGQSKGRNGRIHCVTALRVHSSACERNPGSKGNYSGAKQVKREREICLYLHI